MMSSSLAFAEEPNKTVFNVTQQTDLRYWDYLNLPENEQELHAFKTAMATQDGCIMDGVLYHISVDYNSLIIIV